jgi:DNA-binding response OmpR family regulator
MSRTRILIVDDNRPLAKLVGIRLEQTGHYSVRVEHMPQVAIRAAHEFQPHLMLLDVDMPGMNGPELQRAIRKESAFDHIPVIFLTSLISSDEAGERELISNGSRFLSKSAAIEVVHRCISRAIAAGCKPMALN